ncbi:hypothetical protein [Gilvimarinus polysaccharolyticus]|uniref:hypothetical protein n=1 Tax=Gilvimarinus polysaccharolyticus TaxID=863921 RepID=UPI0006732283|nr:hypothetical protein [Gilvimarinus polysaccharolyticus]
MFRFLAKSALATVVWKRYRRPIGSTLALFISYFFIAMVHSDYVAWATTTAEHGHLWASFVVKWLALIGVSILYYWFNTRPLAQTNNTTESAAKKSKSRRKPASANPDIPPGPDPFATIRTKDKLRSRADVAMDQNKQNPL